MASLKVPGIYQLNVGNKDWGWHRVDDLVLAVKEEFKRRLFHLPEAVKPDPNRISLKWLLDDFGHLNNGEFFLYSDDKYIYPSAIHLVPCDKEGLYVPALWSMDVLNEVKKEAKDLELRIELALYNYLHPILHQNEKRVMDLRLGIFDGKKYSDKEIGKITRRTAERVRQIRSRAVRKMRQAYESVPE